MKGNAALRKGLVFGLAVLLGGCGHNLLTAGSDDGSGVNAYPANYKTDILGAMHVYLNDPTGIREAAVAPPALKQVDGETRYIACVKFNPKKNDIDYAGIRELAAVFLGGRFDHFADGTKGQIEAAKSLCAGAVYAPFPELQNLPP
jgi:hypothetical protein